VRSWEDALERGERRQLLWHPERSVQEIAIAALDHPVYAGAFRRIGARVVSYEEALAQYERRGVGVLVVSPRADWFPRVEVPPEGREEFVALLLLAAEDGEGAAAAQPASTSRRGRRYGRVSVFEANRVAGVYVSDPAEYDARDDGGAYAVHKLYVEGREPGTALLSRSMVGHLLSAIR
jgi:hypothetical protein